MATRQQTEYDNKAQRETAQARYSYETCDWREAGPSRGMLEKEIELMQTVFHKNYVPIWEKVTLSIEEAAAYSRIGMQRLYKLTDDENCPFVLWVGSRRLVKRKELDKFIESTFRRVDPYSSARDKCDKCDSLGYDYMVYDKRTALGSGVKQDGWKN